MKCLIYILIVFPFFTRNLYAQDSLYVFATMMGEKPGDHFSVVKGVGDVNDDGFDDVMVGCMNGNYVKLYLGGSPFDTNKVIRFNGPAGQRYGFGRALASGDLNHDGYNDIVIGNPYYGDFASGRVYIYSGGTDIDTISDLTLEHFGYYYEFGSTLETGDVNGDGIDDLIVGSPMDDYNAAGRAFVYYGGDKFDDTPDFIIEGEAGTMFGTSISVIGDINKDGYNEILFGAPGAGNHGKAYVVYGQEDLTSDSSVVFMDTTSYYYGRFTSALGDMNNDSCPDFAVMSDNLLHIYSGNPLELQCEIRANRDWWVFQSIAGGEDINNDGFTDLALGIQNDKLFYAGTLALYYGGNIIDTIPDIIINGEMEFQYFTFKMDYAGDVNGDRHKDIIIGEYDWDNTEFTNGKAYLYSNNKTIGVNLEEKYIINNYQLYQNYPNPFNPSTTINFELPKESFANLSVWNLLGERIMTLVSENLRAGKYEVKLDGRNLSSGIYFYILKTNDIIMAKKMLLIK